LGANKLLHAGVSQAFRSRNARALQQIGDDFILGKRLGSAHAHVDAAAQTDGSIEQAYRKRAAV
jgi:hypothetical protein